MAQVDGSGTAAIDRLSTIGEACEFEDCVRVSVSDGP